MQLRFENGTPSKIWMIKLPGVDFKVDGDIVVHPASDTPLEAKAEYKVIRRKIKDANGKKSIAKKTVIIITFSRVADGKAVLYATKGKRGLFERPRVKVDYG